MVCAARWPIHPPAYHLHVPELVAHADDFLSLPSHVVADEDLVALVRPILRTDLDSPRPNCYWEGPQLRCPVTVFADNFRSHFFLHGCRMCWRRSGPW